MTLRPHTSRNLLFVTLALGLCLSACDKKDGAAVEAPAHNEPKPTEAEFPDLEQKLLAQEAELEKLGVMLADQSMPAELEQVDPAAAPASGADAESDEAAKAVEGTDAAHLGEAGVERDFSMLNDPTKCDAACNVATSTCELTDRICYLARDHEGEDKYQVVCTRAEEDCQVATEACVACSK